MTVDHPLPQRREQDEEEAQVYTESSPLLRSTKDASSAKSRSPRRPTPLPKLQLSILLLLQLCEPIASQVVYPFIAKLIAELDITGGDNRKVGYYAGIIESVFFVAEAITVLHWSRVSDVVGRKPVLLTGLAGLGISTICFGLSRTFSGLVISRCLAGMLNGNIGVMKSMMGEITDESNRAEGFALMPIVWSAGSTLGPLIGGTLARPHDRFPVLFSAEFWAKYPYFLPCAVSAAFVAFSFGLVAFLLKETVHTRKSSVAIPNVSAGGAMAENIEAVLEQHGFDDTTCIPQDCPPSPSSTSTTNTTNHTHNPQTRTQTQTKKEKADSSPVPLRALLIPRVIIAVLNYGSLAFLDIALGALFPLFFALPVEIGGLGMQPSMIGLCLGAIGLSNGLFQVLFFARIVRRLGPKPVFCAGIAAFVPIFAIFPIIRSVARARRTSHLGSGADGAGGGGEGGGAELGAVIWGLLFVQLLFMMVMDMSFGTIFIYITSAAPNRRSLGATNGLSQTTVAIARAVGPALTTSAFSFSVERNILNGYAVYLFLILTTGGAVGLAARLPRELWKREDEDEEEDGRLMDGQ